MLASVRLRHVFTVVTNVHIKFKYKPVTDLVCITDININTRELQEYLSTMKFTL